MGKLIFITGGARSGKSRFAVTLAKQFTEKVAFVATCATRDEEMRLRIEKHRKSRPTGWETIEKERDVAAILQNIGDAFEVVIVDCITLLVSNLLLTSSMEQEILEEMQIIAEASKRASFTTIVVSNEVGSGIVPNTEIGRKFKDIAGLANQTLARHADEVYLIVSGMPLKIKELGE